MAKGFDPIEARELLDEILKDTFGSSFHADGTTEIDITTDFLWWLTKVCKHVRLRCRNNVAFNNYMNAMFKEFRFETVTKKDQRTGETYPGLEIRPRG